VWPRVSMIVSLSISHCQSAHAAARDAATGIRMAVLPLEQFVMTPHACCELGLEFWPAVDAVDRATRNPALKGRTVRFF
jgi:hypothetical protein